MWEMVTGAIPGHWNRSLYVPIISIITTLLQGGHYYTRDTVKVRWFELEVINSGLCEVQTHQNARLAQPGLQSSKDSSARPQRNVLSRAVLGRLTQRLGPTFHFCRPQRHCPPEVADGSSASPRALPVCNLTAG